MERAGRPACANDRAKGRRALPFSYEIDTKIGVAKLSGQGIVTDEDLSRLVDDIWSDPDWRIDLPTLTDFSAAIALEFTPDGIRRVFELLSSKRDGLSRDGIKSAVVVTRQDGPGHGPRHAGHAGYSDILKRAGSLGLVGTAARVSRLLKATKVSPHS